ncbi:Coil containing protein [Acinetobacter bereziniae]|uniref:Uncharacterized protein n=2 Tax=Acinetobacter bereziniae TaxID=106648 RepID=N8XHH8_ACIBZ|nr:hypothetical protein F963_00123 [Acinetobacter bereziniae NIPH 3]
MVEFTLSEGSVRGDKYILNRKTTQKYLSDIDNKIKNLRWILQEKNQTSYQETLNELQKSRRIALKILDKGGITVVLDGEDLITTYNINSFKRC